MHTHTHTHTHTQRHAHTHSSTIDHDINRWWGWWLQGINECLTQIPDDRQIGRLQILCQGDWCSMAGFQVSWPRLLSLLRSLSRSLSLSLSHALSQPPNRLSLPLLLPPRSFLVFSLGPSSPQSSGSRSLAVCSLNRADLSSDAGAATVFNSAEELKELSLHTQMCMCL